MKRRHFLTGAAALTVFPMLPPVPAQGTTFAVISYGQSLMGPCSNVISAMEKLAPVRHVMTFGTAQRDENTTDAYYLRLLEQLEKDIQEDTHALNHP